MYLYKTRKHDRHMRHYEGFIRDNSVLTMGLALPFAISATYSLQAAVCVIIGMVVVTLPVMLLSNILGKIMPSWVRIPIYVLIAIGLLIPTQMLLSAAFPTEMSSLGIYFPIIAVNTLMIHRSEKAGVRRTMPAVLLDAVMNLLGFSVVMLLAATLREAFGNGTLWDGSLGIGFKLSGLLIPFGGCLVVAFMAAGAKFLGRFWRFMLYQSDLRQKNYPAPGFEDEEFDY